MAKLQDYQDDFILFLEGGFIAVNQADEDSAKKLFAAAHLLQPKNVLTKIGVGYLHFHKLELKQACKAFEEALDQEPDNEMAKTFLGLCFALTPTEVAKGEKLLENSARKAHDPLIKKLADASLAFIDKFVKKAPGPAGKGK
jgi:tetratricopeptide (TPR) repeat protein